MKHVTFWFYLCFLNCVFIQKLPHMSPYIRFCSRQLNAAALIQRRHESVPEFRALLKKCQLHPKVKGMPLTSFLLKPMQRITKYPLLIKKVQYFAFISALDFNVIWIKFWLLVIAIDFGINRWKSSRPIVVGRSACQGRRTLQSGEFQQSLTFCICTIQCWERCGVG